MKKNFWNVIVETAVKAGKRVAHNWPMKLMSLFFAIIIWSFILGQTNPMRVVRVSDISIQVINQSTLASKDLALTDAIEASLPKVWVTLEVPLQEVGRASEMVTVTADMRKINETGTVYVPLTVSTTSSGQVVSQSIDAIQVNVENMISRTFTVTCIERGAMPEGYSIYQKTIQPSSITIQGPESLVRSIETVELPLDVYGLTESSRFVNDLELLDAAGLEVDDAMLNISNQDAVVDVTVFRSKELPILLEKAIIGEDNLAAGYEIELMEAVPSSVVVTGRPEVIDAMTGVDIELIDVKGANADLEVVRSLKLPSGAYVRDASVAQVVIRVTERMASVTLAEVPVRYINLPEGLSLAEDAPKTVQVQLWGPESTLSDLELSDITVTADLAYSMVGKNVIALRLNVPAEYRVTEQSVEPQSVEVTVRLMKNDALEIME